MLNYRDQADGLRRIMARNAARIISVMTSRGQEAGPWLDQLATTMANAGQRTLLMEATQRPVSKYSLQAVAERKSIIARAVVKHPQGYDLAGLIENSALSSPLSGDLKLQLGAIVSQLAYDYDTVMLEARLQSDHTFMLPLMAQHELVVQMERTEEAIKAAYSTIKRICQQYGELPIRIMVTGCSQEQGQQYFMRLNQVCKQFLGVTLQFLGAIPDTDAILKTGLKSHHDSNATAAAAMAFKTIAHSLEKQRLTTPSLVAA